MDLTDEQEKALASSLGPRSVDNWAFRPEQDQRRIGQDLLATVQPILSDLAPHLLEDPAQVLTLDFRVDAEALLIARYGRVMTYRGMAPEAIVEAAGEDAIAETERWLRFLVFTAVQIVRESPSLEALLPSLGSWSPDEELKTLTGD